MSALSLAGDGLGATLVVLAIPLAILAIGAPLALILSVVLGWAGLL